MRRVRVNRKQPKPPEERIAELRVELKDLCAESWHLRTVTIDLQRLYDDTREENIELKRQVQEYRNESIKERVEKERAQKARDTVTKCYDALLWEVSSLSEEWHDRHLDDTGNILGKDKCVDAWADEEEDVA